MQGVGYEQGQAGLQPAGTATSHLQLLPSPAPSSPTLSHSPASAILLDYLNKLSSNFSSVKCYAQKSTTCRITCISVSDHWLIACMRRLPPRFLFTLLKLSMHRLESDILILSSLTHRLASFYADNFFLTWGGLMHECEFPQSEVRFYASDWPEQNIMNIMNILLHCINLHLCV